MMISVRCPHCKADLGSAPAGLTELVSPVLQLVHLCAMASARADIR